MKILITLILILSSGLLYAQKYQYTGTSNGRYNLSGHVKSKHITSVKGIKFYWLTLTGEKIINVTESATYYAVKLNDQVKFESCTRMITNYNLRPSIAAERSTGIFHLVKLPVGSQATVSAGVGTPFKPSQIL